MSTLTILPGPDAVRALDGGREVDRDADAGALCSRLLAAGCRSLLLEAGELPLASPIRLAAGTMLAGRGPATRLRLAPGGIGILGEQVDGCALRDLSLEGGDSGVRLLGCGLARLDGLTLRGCAAAGIELAENAFLCQVQGCQALGCGRAGILLRRLHRDGRCGDYVPTLVNGCTLAGGGAGIECERALVVSISGCQAFQTRGPAFLVRAVSNSVLLSGCRSFQCESDALVVEESHEFNATGNILCWQRGHGIRLRQAVWATLCGNNVIDSGGCQHRAPRRGISIEEGCRGVLATGNSVFNWGGQGPMTQGIAADAGAAEVRIAHNHINFCTGELAAAAGAASALLDNSGLADPAYLGKPEAPDREFARGPLDAVLAGMMGSRT